jgi:hypothetical protein
MQTDNEDIAERVGEPSTSAGGMDPNHPLLQRAQAVLKRQLIAKKLRVEGEFREKQGELQASAAAGRGACNRSDAPPRRAEHTRA